MGKPGAWKAKARKLATIGHMTASVARRTGQRWEHAHEAIEPEIARKRAEQRKMRARARYASAKEAAGESLRRYSPKGLTEALAGEHGVSRRTIRDWMRTGKLPPPSPVAKNTGVG